MPQQRSLERVSYWRGRRLDYPQYRDVPLMIDEQDEAEEASIKLKALESSVSRLYGTK